MISYLLVCFAFQSLNSQANREIKVYIDQVLDSALFAKVKDSSQLSVHIQGWIDEKRNEGYLLAGVDTLYKKDSIGEIHLYRGNKFRFIVMQGDSLSRSELDSLEIKVVDTGNNPYFFAMQCRDWIRQSGNKGYPFSKVELQMLQEKEDSLAALYLFRKGPLIKFHQTDQRQKKLLADGVLNRLTGIYPGAIYRQDLVESAMEHINRTSYLQLRAEPRVLFLGNEGIVWLYLEKARANKFDILLGINPKQSAAGTEYQLTGEAGFELVNSMKWGEKIFLKYENLIENSPKLKIGFDFPYVPWLPFGLASDFKLFRFGEQYIDLSLQSLIRYTWSGFQSTSLSITYLGSSLLNPDSLYLKRTSRLPVQLDYTYIAAGVQHDFNNLDYPLNPTRGWSIRLDVKAGSKTYDPNTVLLSYESDAINVRQQYDSLNQDKEQAIYNLNISKYIQLASRHVLKLSALANGILHSGKLLDNELIRIGGSKNLRGFDEEFYKCAHVILPSLEYRFQLDRNSFLNVFTDFAYLRQVLQGDAFTWNHYQGIGAGIQFQTKVGAFSLQYAIGSGKDIDFNLGKGKLHFGYSNLF